MSISQTEGYIENPWYHVLEENLCSFRWRENETSMKKRFPVLRQKLTQILP